MTVAAITTLTEKMSAVLVYNLRTLTSRPWSPEFHPYFSGLRVCCCRRIAPLDDHALRVGSESY